ncbi:hypothetical protein [Haloarcula argentinensis]|uniref:Uncharacterized protein n=1 Tax=Haloarcula argentinensis TaxID=43776 RepID=A0A830FNA7_HALAR|nr:hypothetical protein [Haloarcula argentinensis]GGM40108.1 hypothetical protein GCM10009006_21520 [Haloarcula argentinensis]
MREQSEIELISICMTHTPQKSKDIFEVFQTISDIDTTGKVSHKKVNVDSEELENSIVVMSDKPADEIETAGEDQNKMLIEFTEDQQSIHIHIDITTDDSELMDAYQDLLESLKDEIGRIDLTRTITDVVLDVDFSEFSFPPVERKDNDYRFYGLRYGYDDKIYVAQDKSEFDPEDKRTNFRMVHKCEDDDFYIDGEENFIQEQVEQVMDSVEDLHGKA